MKKNQQGFTLIELIIVIVILGILAATASPKFLDFTSEAKVSTVQGLSASLKSASNIVYSKALVQGKGSAATAQTTNPTVDIVYGYPAGTLAALTSVMDFNAVAASTTATTSDWEVDATTTAGTAVIYPAGTYDDNSEDCYVQYVQATSTTAAAITTATDDC